jgi:predicted NBD/HSP70 family sugar kinase
MHGWEGFRIGDEMESRTGAPVSVEKDANLLALGEYDALVHGEQDVIVLKVGMGVGAGIISHGSLLRGDQGAAGDLGHLPRHGGPSCRCGQEGCAEATAGGWAIARELARDGIRVRTSQDIVQLARRRHPLVLDLLRAAGLRLGEVLADAVGILNPALIVVGGNLASSSDIMLAAIRERVYEDAHPLATRSLRIELGALGDRAGLLGAGRLAADTAFAGPRVAALVNP